MTPEEARALLDGTTPGPWHVNPRHSGDVLSPKHHWLAGTYETGAGFTADELARAQADAALIAAAPTLAAMIAGMRPEYRAEISIDGDTWHPGGWTKSPEDAEPPDFFRLHRYTRRRIVRRYVTNEEKA